MTRLLSTAATVLILALVAFLMGGCGGSDQAATPNTTTAKPTSTSAAKAASAGSAKDLPESLIGQVIVPTDQSPPEFQKSLQNHRPTVVFFYMIVHTPQNGPSDDEKERTEVTSLESRYRGQVDFYDYSWNDADRYKDLTTLLKVNTTPTVVIINKQSRVQEAWTGFVDDKTIEQAISEALKS